MIPRFWKSVPELSMMSNHILDLMYGRHGYLLNSFNQTWLSPQKLEEYANVISNKGAPLTNCWGFIDGTVRPLCRPGQRLLYNGHERVHVIKFQCIVAPN